MTREIIIVPYDNSWPIKYQDEVKRIKKILENEIISDHHIGSTSIPGMSAKPIIDILLEVRNISKIDEYNQKMIELGYEPRGELGIPGRRYFSREEPKDLRTHHIHAFQSGDENLARHLAFRDYMISHNKEAKIYARLKEGLARKYRYDVDAYIVGKESYVNEIERKALEWYRKGDTD